MCRALLPVALPLDQNQMINHEFYVIYGVSYPVICPSVLVLLLQVQVQVRVVVVMFGGGTNQQNQISILGRLWKNTRTTYRTFSKRDWLVLLVSFLISNLVMKWLPLDQSVGMSNPSTFFASFDGLFVRMCPFGL